MKKATAILLLCTSFLTFCDKPQKPDNSSKKYFDLQAFFDSEIKKLQKRDPVVKKDIAKNELRESKNIRIRNWMNELGLFYTSDINKSSWKDSYEIHTTKYGTEYTAKDTELRTRKIVIQKSEKIVSHISILNQVDNSLYSSHEELDYYPDSLYIIRKKQKILLIGSNDYFVSGRLK